jgi:hypothetical protein
MTIYRMTMSQITKWMAEGKIEPTYDLQVGFHNECTLYHSSGKSKKVLIFLTA